MKNIEINKKQFNLKEYKIDQSPYSKSYYILKKEDEITWGSKPEGSIRISNHWNFYSQGCIHCELAHTEELVEQWLVCEFKNGKYHIIVEQEELVKECIEQIENHFKKLLEKEIKLRNKQIKLAQKLQEKKDDNKRKKFNKEEAERYCSDLMQYRIRLKMTTGTGRNTRIINVNDKIVKFLTLFKIKFEIENDAPRGGQLGDYISVNTRSLKQIAKKYNWGI